MAFFVGLNHTLKIVLSALSSIRFFLDQDFCLVVSPKGPSLDHCYSRCISPLLKIWSLHTISTQWMMYADDTQLYIFVRTGNRAVSLENLSLCLDDIMSWNLCNMLKYNPSKTELRVFHLLNRLLRLKSVNFTFSPATSVIKDLGVTLDSHLTFVPHVNNTCRALSRSFHSIGRIRKYLSLVDTDRAHCPRLRFIKLDYCYSLLYGNPSREIEKLQRLQNTSSAMQD